MKTTFSRTTICHQQNLGKDWHKLPTLWGEAAPRGQPTTGVWAGTGRRIQNQKENPETQRSKKHISAVWQGARDLQQKPKTTKNKKTKNRKNQFSRRLVPQIFGFRVFVFLSFLSLLVLVAYSMLFRLWGLISNMRTRRFEINGRNLKNDSGLIRTNVQGS